MDSKKNRIPRNFNRITGKLLIETSAGKPAEYHVYKNDYGYLGLNLSTGKYFYMFVSMLRNAEIFQITEII